MPLSDVTGNDETRRRSLDLRTDIAHSARVYDVVLGGKDNYMVDREAAQAMQREWPALPVHMRANRDFMHRCAQYLTREANVRQFLDIGTGIPTSPNLHEVAQSSAPDARVVYVDNDPIVLAHSRALMVSTPAGETTYVEADMREPQSILNSAGADILDLNKPVALCVIAIVHFMHDADDPMGVIRQLLDPLPSGSYLAMSVGTADFAPDEVGRVNREYTAQGMPMRLRTAEEARSFFDGLELVDPGLVQVHHWRPEPDEIDAIDDADIAMYGAVARKP